MFKSTAYVKVRKAEIHIAPQYIHIQNVEILHPHFTCEGPHCIHFSSGMDTSFNIRYLKPSTFTCQCRLSELSTEALKLIRLLLAIKYTNIQRNTRT